VLTYALAHYHDEYKRTVFPVKKVKFILKPAMKARRVIVEVQLHCFFSLRARWVWMVNATPRPLYPRARDPVPIVQRAGWAPGPVWTGTKNLASTGIRSPDRPASSESLY
jgi:hypothetical protein